MLVSMRQRTLPKDFAPGWFKDASDGTQVTMDNCDYWIGLRAKLRDLKDDPARRSQPWIAYDLSTQKCFATCATFENAIAATADYHQVQQVKSLQQKAKRVKHQRR